MPRFVAANEHAGERIDKLLVKLLPDVSRATVQRWIGEGRVRLDGVPCRARDGVRAGSVIDVEPGPAPTSDAEPDPSVISTCCSRTRI